MAGILSGLGHSVVLALTASSVTLREPNLAALAYADTPRRGVAGVVDVYRPDGPIPPDGFPSVLLIHGGAFVVGSRRQRSVRYAATRLVEAGFVVGCADYRLLFRGGALQAQLEDIDALRRFWRAQASDWALDAERISIVGFSAGGTLAVLDAARADVPYDRVVSVYGSTTSRR